jgi:hypothetical protein
MVASDKVSPEEIVMRLFDGLGEILIKFDWFISWIPEGAAPYLAM